MSFYFSASLFLLSTCTIIRVLGEAFYFTSLVRSGNVLALNILFEETEGRRRNECDNGICVSLTGMGRNNLVCSACVYSKARIEYDDFNSLRNVAATPFFAVDIDNHNRACTVQPSHLSLTTYPLSTLLPHPHPHQTP